MGISDINRTDGNDNSVITVGESASTNVASLTLKENGLYGLNTHPDLASAPRDSIVHFHTTLLNAGSPSMLVNGSVTPVTFSQTVPLGQTWYLKQINFLHGSTGTPDPGDFGNLAALTNGLIVEYVPGSTYTICNLQTNADTVMFFSTNRLIPAAGAGFLNNGDLYLGTMEVHPHMKMPENAIIRARVRDNLTAEVFIRMSIQYWRVI